VLDAVASRARDGHLLQRLDELRAWLQEDLSWVEAELAPALPHGDHLAARAAYHLLRQPGKRLRPLCVLLAARLGERPDARRARALAAAAELVHAATLLHDDVIDEGDERRGAPAARVRYGNTASILGGDLLLVEALDRVQETGLPEALGRLLETLHAMVAAEAQQLARAGDFQADEGACLEIARGKTAALFGWAMEAGALAGGLAPSVRRDARGVGEALGLAFQLVDDVFDFVGDPSVTGRDALSDLREGKVTWPLAYAARQDPAVLREVRAIARGERSASQHLAAAISARVLATGSLEATYAEAERFAAHARERVARLPPSPARDQLALVVELALVRLPRRARAA